MVLLLYILYTLDFVFLLSYVQTPNNCLAQEPEVVRASPMPHTSILDANSYYGHLRLSPAANERHTGRVMNPPNSK